MPDDNTTIPAHCKFSEKYFYTPAQKHNPKTASQKRYPGVDRGTIQIEYQIASTHGNDGTPVSLDLYDASGRLLHTLVNGDVAKGNYHVQWKAGRSGVYLLRLSTPFAEETRKVVAVR